MLKINCYVDYYDVKFVKNRHVEYYGVKFVNQEKRKNFEREELSVNTEIFLQIYVNIFYNIGKKTAFTYYTNFSVIRIFFRNLKFYNIETRIYGQFSIKLRCNKFYNTGPRSYSQTIL